jgi:high-affinity iron transporter
MLASALVVFREVLEAALVVGIVLAATDGLPRRNFWIATGILTGVGGSIVVAAFADVISTAASGMGQELMNAAVLFIAVVVLGWSIIWMRRHGRELSQRAKAVGQSVASGGVPIHMLAVVVGLSVLREGAEAVLFLFGIASAQGTTALLMLVGGAIGVAAGCAAGYLIYRGLVRIAARHLFGVTSWLLAFLAAGMASQGAATLVAAGILPPIVPTAWDTSAVLSEGNLLGQVLHTLIGYDSHPALIQVLFYAATLGTIVVMMRRADVRKTLPHAAAIIAAAVSLALPAGARAENKVYSPTVVYGEFAIEARGESVVNRGDRAEETQNQRYELEYGVTSWWQTALVGEVSKDAGAPFKYEATGFENIFQITEPGEAWIDSAIYLEYEFANQRDAADVAEGKLLLEKQLGQTVETVNFIFEKEVGDHANSDIDVEYAARTKLRWKPYFEPAIEAFGDIHTPPRDEHQHQIGPVMLGLIPLAPTVGFRYELGWLFGLTPASPDHAIKWLAELEFHF